MSEQPVVVHDDHHMRVDRVTDRVREVLIVVANPAVSSNNNWPVGFWGAELTHPYYELTEAGFTVTIASPAGGKVDMDALSDPRDPSRWSADDLVTMGFVNTPELAALLEDYGDRAVGVQIMPWRLEDALRERGAKLRQRRPVQGVHRPRRAADHRPAAVLRPQGRPVRHRRPRRLTPALGSQGVT